MTKCSPLLFKGRFSGHFGRAIVVLFLVYTAVDIANPQLCDEEFTPGPTTLASTIERRKLELPLASIKDSEESSKDELPSEPHNDEDCFCCCTHVLPGLTTHPNGALDLVSQDRTLISHLITSAHLKALEHPPRSA